jgi:hypothetical protein
MAIQWPVVPCNPLILAVATVITKKLQLIGLKLQSLSDLYLDFTQMKPIYLRNEFGFSEEIQSLSSEALILSVRVGRSYNFCHNKAAYGRNWRGELPNTGINHCQSSCMHCERSIPNAFTAQLALSFSAEWFCAHLVHVSGRIGILK